MSVFLIASPFRRFCRGYTPAECTVMGVPSITTNLSGFGCYIEDIIENPSRYGIYIVDRRLKSAEESIQQLTDYMYQFCQKNRRQRISLRNRTETLSEILDWKRMGIEYMKARILALKAAFPNKYLQLDISKLDTYVPKFSETLSSPLYSSPLQKDTSNEDKKNTDNIKTPK
jgi:hypothetical protein